MCAADGATETSDDSIGSLPREVPASEWDGETILAFAKCKAAFMIDVEAFGASASSVAELNVATRARANTI